LSLTTIAMAAAPASAAETGGASAGGEPAGGQAPTSTPAPAKPAPAVPHAPITSRSSRLTYTGPVFEKTPSGAIVPYVPPAPLGQISSATGGSTVAGVETNTKPLLLVPGTRARYVKGLAAAPMAAPAAVQQIIWAANEIIGLPYIYGGGHASFESPGYDCSGTVSFALHGAALLKTPEDSSEFETFGSHGVGRWVTIFANPGHAYVDVAGLRLDTSGADDPSNQQGPRWRPLRRANSGYVLRHPLGY
jgi:cell wall-associated NlpC family hydrolase